MKRIVIFPSSFGKYSDLPCQILRDSEIEFNRVPNPKSDEENLISILRNYDGVILGLERITDKVMASCPRLKAIARFGVGIDNVDLDAAAKYGITCTNTPGVNIESVAEHVIALMLDLCHRITETSNEMKAGVYKKCYIRQLSGATLGLIGMGPNAIETAKRANAFGMNILAYTHYQNPELTEKYNVHFVSKDDLLEKSDFVSLHCKLTEETRNSFGLAEFSKMKPSACLINCARGELVNEEELYLALTTGKLAAAALDVYKTEPPTDFKLIHLPNVISTPHIAGKSEQAMDLMGVMSARNIVKSLK